MNGYLLGFIVDSVTEIVRVPDEEIETTPPSITSFDKRFISGVAKLGDKLILLLNLEKVLTPDEEQQVIELVNKHSAEIVQ
jgi:purine-binding chemotaxis protein CheW